MIAQTSAIVGKIANYGSWASVSVETQHGRYHVCALRPQTQNANGHWFHITAKKTSAIWCVEAGYGFGRPKNILASGMTFRDAVAWCEHANDPAPEPTRAERYQEWANNGGGIDALVTPRDPGPCIGDDDTDLARVTTPDPEPTPTPADPCASIPAIGGGSHAADTEDAGIKWSMGGWVAASVDVDTKTVTVDGITGTLDTMKHVGCYGEYDLSATVAGVRLVAWMVPTNINDELIQPVTFWPAPEPKNAQPEYATIPAIGGGSHEADTWTRHYIRTGTIANTSTETLTENDIDFSPETLDIVMSAPYYDCAIERDEAGQIVRVTYALDTYDGGHERFTYTRNTNSYADLPPIGGGSHEADTQPKQRTVTTTQKRDNQRAQRAALNEAYKAHAAGKASEVSDILTAFGFEVVSTKDVDGTPVTIWQDTTPTEIDGIASEHIAHATIKQTPYSLRIYNGQPARLPRHGDAELINRVEHGWCACGDARGYAAGLADAILRLIETPDPYMQALDAIEARDAEQSAPDTQAEYGMLYQRISDAADTIGLDADEAEAAYDEYLAAVLPDSSDLVRAAIRSDYTIAAPGHDGRPVIIAEVEHHDISDKLPELVLHGGQPSMSGPWELPVISGGSQENETMKWKYCRRCGNALMGNEERGETCNVCLDKGFESMTDDEYDDYMERTENETKPDPKPHYPAISGGSQDADTISCADCGITSDDTDIAAVSFGDHAPRCWECRRTYLTMINKLHGLPDNDPPIAHPAHLAYAACHLRGECQHDADEPPARFCSQCGHDASPDAPQPTDTGDSHDVAIKCPICDQHIIKDEAWRQTCAATWSTPETLYGHTSAETAYLVDDYPYGARLRCQIRYWIESGKDGRQRFVSQTCNPKNGKWNNPKKSTYSEVMVMTIDSRGHINYTALGSWPTECETRRMEALLGEHITEAQASIMRQWRIMQKAQKHITYTVTSSGPIDLHNPGDREKMRQFDATRQTEEEVNAIWNTAVNRAVREMESA